MLHVRMSAHAACPILHSANSRAQIGTLEGMCLSQCPVDSVPNCTQHVNNNELCSLRYNPYLDYSSRLGLLVYAAFIWLGTSPHSNLIHDQPIHSLLHYHHMLSK